MVESSHVISKVTITTESGKEIRGIIGSKPPHAGRTQNQLILKICTSILVCVIKKKRRIELGNMITL